MEDYLTLLAERTTELLAEGASATYPVSLAASVQIALDRLAAQSPAALVLLTLAAYLAPEPIPLTLFTTHPAQLPDPLATAAGDPLAFTALTRLLRQYGLARVESATLALHRLLAAILRTQPHQQPGPAHPGGSAAACCGPGRIRGTTRQPGRPGASSSRMSWSPPTPTAPSPESRRTWPGCSTAPLSICRPGGNPPSPGRCSNAPGTCAALMLGDDHPDTLESAGSLSLNLWELGQFEPARNSERTPSPAAAGSSVTTTPHPDPGPHPRRHPVGVGAI